MIVEGIRVLIVTYDLKTPNVNYAPFYEALKKQDGWWHHISSAWLISTTKTPQQLHAELAPFLNNKDFILITQVTPPYWGSLPKEAWDWIAVHLGPHG
jgi:hypothetical protein